MRKKYLYPGVKEAERQRGRSSQVIDDDEPDIIHCASGWCPNYKKFEEMGWDTEKCLVWCNMD